MHITHLRADHVSHYAIVRAWVKDEDGEPIEGALVTGLFTSPSGSSTRSTDTTDEDGISHHRCEIHQRGDYGFEVISVGHEDFEYDADANRNSDLVIGGLDATVEVADDEDAVEESTAETVGSVDEDAFAAVFEDEEEVDAEEE